MEGISITERTKILHMDISREAELVRGAGKAEVVSRL